jgi:hypothetical protein
MRLTIYKHKSGKFEDNSLQIEHIEGDIYADVVDIFGRRINHLKIEDCEAFAKAGA